MTTGKWRVVPLGGGAFAVCQYDDSGKWIADAKGKHGRQAATFKSEAAEQRRATTLNGEAG